MTAAQTAMYFSLWQRVRDVRKARGLPCGDVERHALHKQALGVYKSSKDFTNADLDKVKAVFLAVIDPSNLNAQLHQLDQPEMRKAGVRRRCMEILTELGVGEGEDLTRGEWLRGSYLDAITKNITQGKLLNFDEFTEQQSNHVLKTLERRMISARQRKRKHATPLPDNVPW